MTREEAIKILEPGVRFPDFQHTADDVDEACRIAVTSLRAQQTNVKLDRSRWEGCKYCHDPSLGIWIGHHYKYCPYCGAPQNEEAWAELERRINGG